MTAGESCSRRPWGEVGGRPASLVTLRNRAGMVASVSDFGATLVALKVPAAGAGAVDVLLGFDELAGTIGTGYLGPQPFLGAVVGRVANRIAGARFELAGERFELSANDGANHLHGGPTGIHHRLWAAQPLANADAPELALSYLSRAGEEGYPGRLWVTARYRLGPGLRLRLELEAVGDRVTPVSLTHHPYFNLAGRADGDVLGHELTLSSRFFTPSGDDLVPTGEVRSVAGTAFDFRAPKLLGRDLRDPALPGGYDTNFVVAGEPGVLRLAARLRHPASGRELELWTTQAGLQVYTGNSFDGGLIGRGGVAYRRHAGVALEAQAYPNAVNTPHFPPVWLEPNAVYRQVIEYRFALGAGA